MNEQTYNNILARHLAVEAYGASPVGAHEDRAILLEETNQMRSELEEIRILLSRHERRWTAPENQAHGY